MVGSGEVSVLGVLIPCVLGVWLLTKAIWPSWMARASRQPVREPKSPSLDLFVRVCFGVIGAAVLVLSVVGIAR